MKEEKLHLISKIFQNGEIRTVWNSEEEKYYISVVDIVGILSESENPRNYWKVLKSRLKKENLRDNMSDIEVALADLGEIATRELVKKHKPYGLEKNMEYAKMGGNVAKVAKLDLENKLGDNVIKKDKIINYKK